MSDEGASGEVAQAKTGPSAPGDGEAPEFGTPRQGSRRHHSSERGLQRLPESALKQGKFGRLFQDLPSHDPERALINRLVDEFMREVPDGENDPGLDNPFIPSGYTYFGQFLDHDITFDPVSSLDRQNDPDALHNFRTPRLDLDSVYGTGPDDQPYLYDDDDPAVLLFTKRNVNGEPDLQRNAQQRALIGDPRNDENVIVSQLHLLFVRLHNRLLADIRAGGFQQHLWDRSVAGQFREAQRLTR